jgi:hypothetical protein
MPLNCTAPLRSTAVVPDARRFFGHTIRPSIAIGRERPSSGITTAPDVASAKGHSLSSGPGALRDRRPLASTATTGQAMRRCE